MLLVKLFLPCLNFFVFSEADKYNLCDAFHFGFDDAATFLHFCLLVPKVTLSISFIGPSHAAFLWPHCCLVNVSGE